MMHEFVTYADGTLVVSSDIRKKENGEGIRLWALIRHLSSHARTA